MFPCASIVVDEQSIVRISTALLARVQATYAASAVSLPSRQIRTLGDSAFDCEQLVVSLMSLREGLIGTDTATRSPCEVPVIATFQVTVVRCVPVPDDSGVPPTPAALAASADVLMADAYLLMKSSCRFDMFGADILPALHPSALGGMGVEARVEVQEAMGGMQAVTLNIDTVIG